MKRFAQNRLDHWLKKTNRKPLVIRGARQVGKSTLVQQFAKSAGYKLVEVNLEKHFLDDVFKTFDSKKIIREIEAINEVSLSREKTILFLDEIQASPMALPALRYLYEDLPALPIIAAGSLLEFLLNKHQFSMPVGRIEYLHLGPMTFKEYLLALGENHLFEFLEKYDFKAPIATFTHQKLLDKQREFLFVGGMPEAVFTFAKAGNFSDTREVHQSILQTYQDDFSKYTRFSELIKLRAVFEALPSMVGKKVKYSRFSAEYRSQDIKNALDLLRLSRLVMPAYHTDCTGLPLGAGKDESVYKLYFLDVGLLNSLYGLDWQTLSRMTERDLINEGLLAEQFIAQHLAYKTEGAESPSLFYWLREGKAGNAEVDFIISHGKNILPLEVKAGQAGSLKSLFQFVESKNPPYMVRFDLNLPSIQKINSHTIQASLASFPLYFIEELTRFIDMSPLLTTFVDIF